MILSDFPLWLQKQAIREEYEFSKTEQWFWSFQKSLNFLAPGWSLGLQCKELNFSQRKVIFKEIKKLSIRQLNLRESNFRSALMRALGYYDANGNPRLKKRLDSNVRMDIS